MDSGINAHLAITAHQDSLRAAESASWPWSVELRAEVARSAVLFARAAAQTA